MISSARAETSEDQVKAVFLYNFISYVSWHKNVNPVICIYGSADIANSLDIIRKKHSGGRNFSVRNLPYSSDLKGCHMAFISRSRSSHMKDFVRDAHSYGALTVSDISRFVYKGGVIGFINRGNKIKLQINNEVAIENGVKISSRLLKISDVVK